jgi:xylose isomerase
MQQAIITSFLGKLKDRFCEYQEPRTIEQKFQMMSRIPGATGVEVVHPYEVPPPDELLRLLDTYQLEVSAVNVNIKLDPLFHEGALSNPDAAVRAKAVDMMKAAKDYAGAIGADKVTCCPLSDGYDYAFHTHYLAAWRRMVDAVREAASHRPDIPLFMEYKPSETRVHCLLDSAAKTILLADAVGTGNVGITIDVGHSIYGGETPAEALAHVSMSGHPYYVHVNDNNGKWDWDLMVGTCNLWTYLEFLFYLKELGYDGWITSDTSPVRQDAIETFAFNVRFTDRLWSWLDTVERDVIRQHLEDHQFIPVLRLLEPHLFNSSLRGAAPAGS